MKLGNAIEDRTSPRNIWNIKQNAGYATYCTIEWVPPKLDCTFGTVRKFQMAFLFVLGFVPWELNETGYELSFAYATKSYAKWIKPLRTFAPLVLWWMITAARAQSINFCLRGRSRSARKHTPILAFGGWSSNWSIKAGPQFLFKMSCLQIWWLVFEIVLAGAGMLGPSYFWPE